MFAKYVTKAKNEVSFYKDIPIDQLQQFKETARMMGMRFRIYYRGPRLSSAGTSMCLRKDAKRFAAYPVKCNHDVFGIERRK